MDCRDRRYCKTYFAVDNRLYAFVQFDRPKIENHLLTPESMKKRKSGFTLSGKNLAAGNRIFLYVATRFFLRYNEKNGGRKQMKILLTAINAKYIHSNLAVYNLRAYAAHYAKGMADSDTVEIGEYTINNQMEDILEGIYKAKPDVLMFSCYIWNIAFVEELAEEFHKLRPEVPVWVGGPVDVLKTMKMVLLHDVIEIDAGDTYAYDTEGNKTKRERELKAADRIFGLLPEAQQKEYRGLWDEFEAMETPESKFANMLDKVQPLFLNDASGGISWEEHGVKKSQVLKRDERVHEGSERIWEYAKSLIEKNAKYGKLIDE